MKSQVLCEPLCYDILILSIMTCNQLQSATKTTCEAHIL